ncbi:M50 family metallopeptidase [Catenovulum sp. SM1970]|uniref:M50 family metallopeptidase n=1 Tax=Marinifaba aquimaris TaxID=2741323 RepID=UPI0015728486|nr:M50 family metallopeptidase [Marinifaba aquimaris]NTS78443.1 M50 family metallopeptidase [Marinifaba aquimaris]
MPNSRLWRADNARIHFFVLLALSLLLQNLPWVQVPLTWLATYFHEISHGLAALLTGGNIHYIQLDTDGSGLCVTSGGINFIVTFSGYIGASLLGYVLYTLALSSSKLQTSGSNTLIKLVNLGLILLLLVSLIFWTSDLLTLLIQLVLIALFASCYLKVDNRLLALCFQFIALNVLIDAIQSPLYLIDNRQIGDGATLARMSFIPEFIWVMVWFSFALFCLYKIYQQVQKT